MKTAGLLLVGGATSFGIGASIPARWSEVFRAATLERYMQLVGPHVVAWRWTNALMIAGVVLYTAGLMALAQVSSHPAVAAGAVVFGIAATTWVVVAAYRATVAPLMWERLEASGSLPDWYPVVAELATALVLLYVVIGNLAHAVVGIGLLRGGSSTPAWAGWLVVAFSVVGGLSQLPPVSRVSALRGLFQVVALVQLAPLLIGILALTRS